MVIGITGGDGVLGRQLVRFLEARRIAYAILDRKGLGERYGNIHNTQDLNRCFASCAGIIHLAGVSSVACAAQDPEACRYENIEGTRNIVQFCGSSLPQKWILCVSSREVYGVQQIYPIGEDAPCRPVNDYGYSKWQAEQIVCTLGRDLQVPHAIVRLSNVYGSPQDLRSRVVMQFAHQAITHQEMTCLGEKTSCDFIHIHDVCRAILTIILHLQSGLSLPIINLCSAIETPLVDLAREIVHAAGSRSLISICPPSPYHTPRFVGSYKTAYTKLGWRPDIPLKTGIANLIKDLKIREQMA